ncbi:MAG: CBS domain-containing protein [Bdellovibrio sp.]|nr:CBS domain-containing protein [Bdellovibrio sp.]
MKLTWEKGIVVAVPPDSTLAEAAQMMRDQQVGDVLVMNSPESDKILGVITDRDIALCLGTQENPNTILVGDVMSRSIVTASVDDEIFKLIYLMKTSGVTRLPLLDERGRVVGVATAKNLIEILLGSLFDLTQIGEIQRENERSHH